MLVAWWSITALPPPRAAARLGRLAPFPTHGFQPPELLPRARLPPPPCSMLLGGAGRAVRPAKLEAASNELPGRDRSILRIRSGMHWWQLVGAVWLGAAQ